MLVAGEYTITEDLPVHTNTGIISDTVYGIWLLRSAARIVRRHKNTQKHRETQGDKH